MNETKVVTGKVRFSYAHVFEPSAAQEGQEKKYSVAVLVPKKDKKTLAKIETAIAAALEAGKGKFGGKIPKKWKHPLRDGDEEKEDDEAYAGMMFFNASDKKKPGLVDEDLNEIIDKADFYSGCYGRVSVNFFAFNTAGNQGVAVGLNNIQKLEDGEPLGALVSSAADDFGSDDDDLLG